MIKFKAVLVDASTQEDSAKYGKDASMELAEKIKEELDRLFKNKKAVKVSGGLVRLDDPTENYKKLALKIEYSMYTKTVYVYFNYRGKLMSFGLRISSPEIQFGLSSVVTTVGKRENYKKVIASTIDYVDGIPQNRL